MARDVLRLSAFASATEGFFQSNEFPRGNLLRTVPIRRSDGTRLGPISRLSPVGGKSDRLAQRNDMREIGNGLI